MNASKETLPCFKALQYFFRILMLGLGFSLGLPEPMNASEETLHMFWRMAIFLLHSLFLFCFICLFFVCSFFLFVLFGRTNCVKVWKRILACNEIAIK